jgi:hypothetical protein
MTIAQAVVVGIMAASLVNPVVRHGELYVGEYNFPKQALRVLIWMALLKIGGFF